MSNVGYGTLVVIPSVRGISGAVAAQVTAPLNQAGIDAGRSFGSKLIGGVATGVKVIGGTILAVGGAVAAVAAKGGLDRALNIQDARASLAGLGHDTQSIEGIMGSALDAVRGTAFGLDQAAATAATAVAAGIKPGLELTRTLKLTADAATIAKTPLAEMGSIVNKVATAGYLTRDVVNQLQDRGIPILQLVAAQYGVTAEAASEMVSRGEVDFATFQNALEQGMGGAALKSGETARGAFANIGAAMSRLGAMFVQPAVEGSPALFQAVARAVDRAAVALQPFADYVASKAGPAFASMAAYIDTVDFGRIVNGIHEFYLGAVDVKDLLLTGFTENETLLPPSVVDGLRIAHDVFAAIAGVVRDTFAAFQGGGDLSGVGAQFSSIGDSVTTLQPALESFVTSLPNIGGAVATLAAAGLQVLVNVLSFLADNVDTIIAFMPVLIGAYLAWKGATALVFASNQNLMLLQLRMMPLTTANTFARLAAARAELQLAAATGTNTAAQNGGIVATVRNTAATIGQKVAMLATRGAMVVATAAQWAWNAAMSANPIAIIILAIAALVAGLVWFFTQTELGKAIWENVMSAIGTAVTWLWESVISPVFTAIGAIFTWIWENILAPIVMLVVNYFRLWGAIVVWLWQNAVMPAVNAIGAVFTWLWQNVLKPVVDAIAAIFTWVWETILKPVFDGIAATVNALGAVFTWLWQNVIAPVWNGIQSAISAAWTWIDANVFTPFKLGIDLLGKAFESTGKFIGDVWNNIKSAAAMPINFVLDTVWNKGLRSFWNDMVTTLGLSDMKLPAAQLIKFANGSENHVAQIAGAGAMRLWAEPETGGEAYIPLSPAKRSRSTAILANVANRFGFGITPYANGGIGDGAGNLVGDVLDNIAGAASVAWEFLTNPAAAIEKHIVDGIIGPLLGDAPPWLRAIGQLPINLVRGFTGKLKDAAPKAAPAASGGMGWQALWQMVQAGVPGAVKTSDFRPGSRTVNGGQSYHALGRAIDVIPATMATFNRMLAMFPNARELIFSPAGGRQLQNGKPHNWGGAVRAQHWDHVHLAMANGGVIPGLAAGANIRARRGGTVAILGEGGRSETVSDLGLTNRTMAATLALVNKASEPSRDDSINFNGPVTVADPDELARRLQRKRRRARAKAGVDGKVSIP